MDDRPNLRELAKHWLPRLEEAGLPEPTEEPDGTTRLRLLDGREVDFRLRPEYWQYTYKGARRDQSSERMERAILAALVALEASPVNPRRKAGKDSKVTRQGARLRVGMRQGMTAGADEFEAMQQAVENDPVLKDAGTDASQAEARLSFAEALLKHYHPDFDDRPKEEKIDLLMHAARHVDEALRGLEALQDFVHAGRLGGRATKKAANPERDIQAAELNAALGLKHREIGEILDIPLSEGDKIKGGHKAVADMVKRDGSCSLLTWEERNIGSTSQLLNLTFKAGTYYRTLARAVYSGCLR